MILNRHKMLEDVIAFQKGANLPVLTTPQWPAPERIAFRTRFVQEEVIKELLPAIAMRDMVETADAIADAIWVLLGMAIEFGIPIQAIWDYAVSTSNFAKFVDGKAMFDPAVENGLKIIKPPGWQPPTQDIIAILEDYGYVFSDYERKKYAEEFAQLQAEKELLENTPEQLELP